MSYAVELYLMVVHSAETSKKLQQFAYDGYAGVLQQVYHRNST